MDEDKMMIDKTQVAGIIFIYWPDFRDRGVYAQNVDTKEIQQISKGGYISNDLTIRKAIARAFSLETFRRAKHG